ncbi:MAG: GerMN domain-containing protein [Treponemataceae bacterium]
MDFFAKNKSLVTVISTIIITLAIFSIFFTFGRDYTKRSFYYETIHENKIRKEYKYLKNNTKIDPLQQYIEELLLGPFSNNLEALFPKKTRLNSFFLHANVLYIELSEDALQVISKKMKKTIEVLKKNIYTNFKNIDFIHVYIAGNELYAE